MIRGTDRVSETYWKHCYIACLWPEQGGFNELTNRHIWLVGTNRGVTLSDRCYFR